MDHYEVIVVGAGVGGLSAAAYLAQAGIQTLVIEQTAFPGGRCYSRVIDGAEYDIGALYLGGRVPAILRTVFGLDCHTIPFRGGIAVGEHLVSFPFDRQTLRELGACGVSWWTLARFLFHVPQLFMPSAFERCASVGDLLNVLTPDENIRFVGDVMFGVSGTSPDRLPSHYLRLNGPVAGYRATNPEYLVGGNRTIADRLLQVIRGNGHINFEEKVERLLFDGQRVCGVVTDRREYRTDFVISNADIQTTVLKLGETAVWPDDYQREVEMLQKPLSIVNVFLTFDSGVQLPPGYGVFFVADDPVKEFQWLEKGCFPPQSMFVLYVPTQIVPERSGCHRATLQFYCPRGNVTLEKLNRQVQKVMTTGLARLYPRFSTHVMGHTVYPPERYVQEFGLQPYVFGVSPALGQRRFPIRMPIRNMFCVGDSVQPGGPCVPQAMESGIAGAQMVVQHMKAPVADE